MKIGQFNISIRIIISRVLSKAKTYYYQNNHNIIIEKGTLIYWRTKLLILNKGKIIIGKNSKIGRSRYCYHAGMPFYTCLFVDKKGGKIKIGDNCRLNGVYIHAYKYIEIGDNCVCAAGVNIIDSNGHEVMSIDRTNGCDVPKEIIIGNNVWIGLNVIILKGTIIGDNSIIKAGSIIKGSYPKNSIISSNSVSAIK